MMFKVTKTICVVLLIMMFNASPATGFSITEIHYKYGDLKKGFQGGGREADTNGTHIISLEHSSDWQYGSNYLFLDYAKPGLTAFEMLNNITNENTLYGEWYSNFSLGKIMRNNLRFGLINDIGIIAGFNLADEIDTLYYLPGVRFALTLPGFDFANIDVTAHIQDGKNNLGVIEDDSFMVNVSWAYPFSVAGMDWSVAGHVEYNNGADQHREGVRIGERAHWVLSHTKVRMDIGKYFGGEAKRVFVGVEYQYWHNKSGDKNTDESVVQALFSWRF